MSLMVLATAKSKNGVSIRLTNERWYHITLVHPEINHDNYSIILEVVKNPDFIFKGTQGELIATRREPGKKAWIVVPYKEVTDKDGFILTAYLTTNLNWLLQKEVIWNKD